MDDLCTCGGPNGCMIHRDVADEPLTDVEAQAILDLLDGRGTASRPVSTAKVKLQRLALSGHKRRW